MRNTDSATEVVAAGEFGPHRAQVLLLLLAGYAACLIGLGLLAF